MKIERDPILGEYFEVGFTLEAELEINLTTWDSFFETENELILTYITKFLN